MDTRIGVVAILALLVSVAAEGDGPLPISPGGLEGVVAVSGRCPTLDWTLAEGAETIDLVVYRLPVDESTGSPELVLTVTFPGTANGWTPAAGQCLEPGGRYAWSVRSSAAGEPSEWSEALLFEVVGAPSAAEVRDALATLRLHLGDARPASKRPEPDPSLQSRPSAVRVPRDLSKVSPNGHPLYHDTVGARVDLELVNSGVREYGAALIGYAVGEVEAYPYYDWVTGVYGRAVGLRAIGVEGRGSMQGGFFVGATGLYAASYETVAASFLGAYDPFTETGTPGLWVEGTSCCNGSSPNQHVAWLLSSGGTGGDVLALQGSGETPDEFTNFVTFFADSTVIGEIQGDGSGGVEFDGSVVSPSADFAEFLPKLDTDEDFRSGDVVGLFAGKISRRTSGADRAMVISTHPIVAAGRPEPENAAQFEKVAFLGQVPVRVRGQVEVGDLLVPSGDQDGTAMAATTSRLSPRQAQLLIGRSLESATDGEDSAIVKAMVGLPERASASALGAARKEIQLYRWLLVAVLLTGLALSARRQSFG